MRGAAPKAILTITNTDYYTDYYALVLNSHGTWLHEAFLHIVVVLLGFPKGIKISIAQGAQPRGQY